jgi:hypothetical protein
MKQMMITTFAAVSLIAAATTALRLNSPFAVGPTGTTSLQERHSAAGVLPIEDFEDMSLVYATATKR